MSASTNHLMLWWTSLNHPMLAAYTSCVLNMVEAAPVASICAHFVF